MAYSSEAGFLASKGTVKPDPASPALHKHVVGTATFSRCGAPASILQVEAGKNCLRNHGCLVGGASMQQLMNLLLWFKGLSACFCMCHGQPMPSLGLTNGQSTLPQNLLCKPHQVAELWLLASHWISG